MKLSPSEVAQFYQPFVEHLFFQKFKRVGEGSFRTVYRRKNLVIKIPRKVDGVLDNMMEARAYKKYGNNPTSRGIVLAPCRLLSNYALAMPFVSAIDYNSGPPWTLEVEGSQVGSFKGRIVAFDFALDLQERYEWEKNLLVQSYYFQNVWKEFKPYLFPSDTLSPSKDLPHDAPMFKLGGIANP